MENKTQNFHIYAVNVTQDFINIKESKNSVYSNIRKHAKFTKTTLEEIKNDL